ncbi:MAG: GAF domain-containing protein [Planctomycetes bacterium]|nr:GAF domain-containing protein [Planctomycetota bacterium]
MAKIIFKDKTLPEREILLDKDVFAIGRMPENDLEVSNALVSRKHAEIIKRGEKFTVYDLGSSNGTTVNNEKVDFKVLVDGDQIGIGSAVLVFRGDEPGGSGLPESFKMKTQASSLMESEIVKSVKELAKDYDIDLRQSIAQGISIKDVSGGHMSRIDKLPGGQEQGKFYILYQLGKGIVPTKGLNEVLEITMSIIFDVINAERGVIMLYDKKSGTLLPKLAMSKTSGRLQPSEITVSSTITNKVLSEKVSIITSDAKHDPRFQAGISIVQLNIRSALCVPLWERDDVFGVIYLDNLMKSYAFQNQDLELLTAIANLVAIRIMQEELYAQLHIEATKRQNLEKYHPPDVVEMILKQGEMQMLGVQEKVCSVLFADIESFTKLAERLKPQQVAFLLNEYFEIMTHKVFENKGTVNKYIGDCVMATFGAPVSYEDHAKKAVQAGVDMLRAHKKSQQKDETTKYNMRIGINTGEVVAGNIGTERLLEYTVLGDIVNIAKRLEEFAPPNNVVIGEQTYELVKDSFNTKDLGLVKLKGKDKPLRAFQVVDDEQ